VNHFEEQGYLLYFQNKTKHKFPSKSRVGGFESMLFHYSITQDNVVDTPQFTSAGEGWDNLYADDISRR
jgi:hypothetical protein